MWAQSPVGSGWEVETSTGIKHFKDWPQKIRVWLGALLSPALVAQDWGFP